MDLFFSTLFVCFDFHCNKISLRRFCYSGNCLALLHAKFLKTWYRRAAIFAWKLYVNFSSCSQCCINCYFKSFEWDVLFSWTPSLFMQQRIYFVWCFMTEENIYSNLNMFYFFLCLSTRENRWFFWIKDT